MNVVAGKENQVNVYESAHIHYDFWENPSKQVSSWGWVRRVNFIFDKAENYTDNYRYLVSRLEAVIWLLFKVPWLVSNPDLSNRGITRVIISPTPFCSSSCSSFSVCSLSSFSFISSNYVLLIIFLYAVEFPLQNFIHLPTSLEFSVFETSGYNCAIWAL